MMESDKSIYRALANAWRREENERRGCDTFNSGFVLIWRYKVYGWKSEVRDPHCERPGVIGVDQYGIVYKSVGGNYYDGSEKWLKV